MIGGLKKLFARKDQPSEKKFKVYSPLIRRIVGVHILVLVLLGVSFLYIGQYQNELIEREKLLLKTEVNLLATLFGRGEELIVDLKTEDFRRGLAGNLMRSLLQTMDRQIIVFDNNGHMAFDNEVIQEQFRKGGRFASLPPQGNILAEMVTVAEFVSYLFPSNTTRGLPFYRHSFSMHIQSYPDAAKTLKDGQSHVSLWRTHRAELILTASAPVFFRDEFLGVVYIVRTGNDITQALLSVRWDMLKAFLVAVFLSLFLSYYLSDTIAKPLARLADAANQVRLSKKRNAEIPDYSQRMDEIAYLSETLRDMTKALWGRIDAIQDFAADVAHELKNPLSSLKSAIETLLIVEDPEKRERLLAIIEHDFQRIDLLISDISEASRIDAELSKMTPEVININNFLRDIVDIYEAQNELLSFELTFTTKDIMTQGNRTRLAQVFHNIIDNAVSFSPEHGSINIAVKPIQETIEIRISDEGGGIQTEDFDKIFKRFYTERPAKEDFGTHSGLGLSIARQITEGHGGTLTAENIMGRQGRLCQGACFIVRLPLFKPSDNRLNKRNKTENKNV